MSEIFNPKSFADVAANETGFLRIECDDRHYEPVEKRIRHWNEFVIPHSEPKTREQAERCMNCGIPFCMGSAAPTPVSGGCPIHNSIPDFNDLVYREDWLAAWHCLDSTNNFPEFTGRICPAPCEAACVLNVQEDTPVTIKTIECAIVDKAFKMGWVVPEPPKTKTGKKVAIVGSGPAGLACAQQLARVGHDVHVFEKHAKAGGLLRYGIPDFKMEKHHVDRRIAQMEPEGVVFHYGTHVGVNLAVDELLAGYDAIVLAGGSEKPRDLVIPGRELKGIHFAMEFLPQQNRRVSGEPQEDVKPILATGKRVIIIGGGDTGSDCVGTSVRQGALSVTNFEIMPEPPEKEDRFLTWPGRPRKLVISPSQKEAGIRPQFSIMAQKFSGENAQVKKLHCLRVDEKMEPIVGEELALEAGLVLLAMGFVNPVHEGMIKSLGVALSKHGNVEANDEAYLTSVRKVFAAGDMRRGQSLVVWAIREGRQGAHAVDKFLMGETLLPR
jgi:glutamate synthase (NADPH) small chain